MIDRHHVKVETSGNLVEISLNRPEKMNALNRSTLEELESIFAEIEKSDEIRGVIVTGTGDRAFAAGADIEELSRLTPLEAREVSLKGQSLFNKIEQCSRPVIAAVNGFCLGGGCELALACHLRIASANARFGQPEVQLGLIPGYGGTQRLPRIVGKGRALELILSGKIIDAEEAEKIGLANRVVSQEGLLSESRRLLEGILSNAPLAVRYSLQAVSLGLEAPLPEGLELEAALFGLACASEDMKEGTRAFLSKRKPEFTGR